LKGRRFCGATDINSLNAELNPICQLLALLEAHHILHVSRISVKNATKELKRLSENEFQHLYSRWPTCIFAQGDCFEGNVAYMMELFCKFSEVS
jgi:hypothetical protein